MKFWENSSRSATPLFSTTNHDSLPMGPTKSYHAIPFNRLGAPKPHLQEDSRDYLETGHLQLAGIMRLVAPCTEEDEGQGCSNA